MQLRDEHGQRRGRLARRRSARMTACGPGACCRPHRGRPTSSRGSPLHEGLDVGPRDGAIGPVERELLQLGVGQLGAPTPIDVALADVATDALGEQAGGRRLELDRPARRPARRATPRAAPRPGPGARRRGRRPRPRRLGGPPCRRGRAPPPATRSVKQSALPGGSWRTSREDSFARCPPRPAERRAGARSDERAAAEERRRGEVLLDGLEGAGPPPARPSAAPASPSAASSSTLTRQIVHDARRRRPGGTPSRARPGRCRRRPRPRSRPAAAGRSRGRRRPPDAPTAALATMPLRPRRLADPAQALDPRTGCRWPRRAPTRGGAPAQRDGQVLGVLGVLALPALEALLERDDPLRGALVRVAHDALLERGRGRATRRRQARRAA